MEHTMLVSCCHLLTTSTCWIKDHISKVMLAVSGLSLIMILTSCDAGLRQTSSHNYLLLEFTSDRSQAHVNEPIHMRFTINNTGFESTVVESNNMPVMDIYVEVAGGGTLLTWSAENPDQISHRIEWKPGESKVIEWSWTSKEGDVYIGATHNLFLSGSLSNDSKVVQAANVMICASNVCR